MEWAHLAVERGTWNR